MVFLCAPDDFPEDKDYSASPLIEITYNWPDVNGKTEVLSQGRNFGHLAFAVDNIYEYCQNLLNKGVTINRPPRDGYMAFIKSPDNISIEILQKDAPLKLTEPWARCQIMELGKLTINEINLPFFIIIGNLCNFLIINLKRSNINMLIS